MNNVSINMKNSKFSELIDKNLAILMLVMAACFFGAGPMYVKLSNISNPFVITGYRVLIAFVILLTYFIAFKKKITIPAKINFKIFIASFFLSVDFSAYYLAMNYAPMTNVSLLNNLSPIFVALINWGVFKQKPTKNIIIGIILSIAGLIILIGFDTTSSIEGSYIALLSAIFYATYIIIAAPAVREISPLQVNLYLTMYCSIFCFLFMFAQSSTIIVPTLEQFKYLTINSLFSQVIGQSLVMFSLQRLSTGVVSITLLLEPVAVMILSWLLFNEMLTPLQMCGAGIVFFSIFISKRG